MLIGSAQLRLGIESRMNVDNRDTMRVTMLGGKVAFCMLMMQINEADDDHDAAESEVVGKLLVDDDDDGVGKVQQADDAGGREEADLLEEATSHFPSRTSHPAASTSSSSPS